MVEKKLLYFIIASVTAINIAYSLPILRDQSPPSGSYWPGGMTNFSVYATEGALNTSDVYMEIKAAEETSRMIWDRHYLGCVNINENTHFCSKLVSLLIVGDDTLESFYFNASDTFGNYGSLGNKTHPLNITIDINPPLITAVNVANYSYVSSKKDVLFNIFDRSSGVNITLSQGAYGNTSSRYGNETWNSSYIPMTYANPLFSMKLNYSALVNNGTYSVYVNATDNVGNMNESKILDLLIDNELPTVNIYSPSSNELLYGTSPLLINAQDMLSGIKTSNIYFVVKSGQTSRYSNAMSCTGQTEKNVNCSYSLYTNPLGNGDFKLVYVVDDMAENEKNQTVDFKIDNSFLQLYINSPLDNSYTNRSATINANIVNHENRIQTVKFRFDPSNDPWAIMNCDQSFYCDYTWNTNTLQERSYRLTVNVTGNFNYYLNKSITVTVDRTLPQLYIIGPSNTTIAGTAYPQLTITDENLVNSSAVKFRIGNISSSMSCSEQLFGKLYNCVGSFNSYMLNNNTYSLIYEGADYAGNRNTSQIEVLIANPPGSNEIYSNVSIDNTTNATMNFTFPTINLTVTTTTIDRNITAIFDSGKQTNVINETKNITIIQMLSSPIESAVNSFKNFSSIKKMASISILIAAIAGVILFIIGRKTVKKPPKIEILSIENIDSLFVEERSKLQFAYNYITSAFGMNEVTTLKDYVKNAFGYLEKMDKTSFLKSGFEKSLEFMDKSLNTELSKFIKDSINQIYVDDKGKEVSRTRFIDDIKSNLDEALGTDDINKAHETLGIAKSKIEEFIKFSDKEIEMWKKYMEKANNLQKTTDKEKQK